MKKKHKKQLSRNGYPFGTFKISIDDGFCEYSYPLRVNQTTSIWGVYQKLCAVYKRAPKPGTLRIPVQ